MFTAEAKPQALHSSACPLRFGYTSPAGSTSETHCYPSNACPSGTEAPKHRQISSVDECVCKVGTDLDSLSHLTVASSCCTKVITHTNCMQTVSEQPAKLCVRNAQHYFATDKRCLCSSMSAWYTPQQGYGTRGSGKDATCSLCPAGTYSSGGSMEACIPCPFGFTSPAGATGKVQCQLTPQACPIGQWAPDTAVAEDECRCYPGFGGASMQGARCRRHTGACVGLMS